jgi:hypothetical protein
LGRKRIHSYRDKVVNGMLDGHTDAATLFVLLYNKLLTPPEKIYQMLNVAFVFKKGDRSNCET